MTAKAIIKRIISDDLVEIEVQRESACGHDCASCQGCGAPTSRITTTATGGIGTKIGETVTIEGDTATVLKGAAFLYIQPLVLFFLFYFVGESLLSISGAFTGCVGFAIGIALAVGYSQKMSKKQAITYRIVNKN